MKRANLLSLLLALFAAAVVNAAEPRIATNSQWSGGASVAYTYDAAGNVTSIGTDQFRYDGAGRLVTGTTNGVQQLYTYDVYANRTDCEQAGADCQPATINSETNRISGASYDNAGSLLQWDGHTYTYDAVGMMTSDVGAISSRQFLYTADDERIAVQNISNVTNINPWWQWTIRGPDGKVLREFTSTGGSTGLTNWAWTRDSIWRDGQLLSSHQKNGDTVGTHAYHLDHLGTPRLITTLTGATVGIHDYYPFGPEAPGGTTEVQPTPHRFTGHERDAVDGEVSPLDYMHARYYSGREGRFLSVDPYLDLPKAMHYPQGWNRYSYVRNNPVNMTDPDGRCEAICWGVILGVVGGIFMSGDVANAPSPSDSPQPNGPGFIGGAAGGAALGVGGANVIGRIETVTRYMTEGEANTARDTGNVPNVGRDGKPRPTHVTTDKPVNDSTVAQNRYEITKPTHRATVPKDRVPGGLGTAPDGRPTTSGGGSQAATNNPIPVKPHEIKPMDQSLLDRILGWFR